MREYLKTTRSSNVAVVEKLTSEQALKLVQEGDVENHAGFDALEAERLGLTPGRTVAVTPTDSGKWTLGLAPTLTSSSQRTGKNHPTVGTLIGLNREEVVIRVKGTSGTPLHVHFPRLNFAIRMHNAKL